MSSSLIPRTGTTLFSLKCTKYVGDSHPNFLCFGEKIMRRLIRSKVCNLWSLALIISARKTGSPVGTRLSSLSTFFAKKSRDSFEKTSNASANVIQGVWFVKMVLIIQIGKNCPPSGNWSKNTLKLPLPKNTKNIVFQLPCRCATWKQKFYHVRAQDMRPKMCYFFNFGDRILWHCYSTATIVALSSSQKNINAQNCKKTQKMRKNMRFHNFRLYHIGWFPRGPSVFAIRIQQWMEKSSFSTQC